MPTENCARRSSRGRHLGVLVAVGALTSFIGSCLLAACLVDVDESLLDGVDAKTDAPHEGGSPDSAPDGGVPEYTGMPCGTGHCMPPQQVCCTGGFGNPKRSEGSCTTENDCESGDFWECMNPADCAHAGRPPVCCANHFQGGGFSKARCETTCGANATVLCNPGTPSCTPPAHCVASTEFDDLFECR